MYVHQASIYQSHHVNGPFPAITIRSPCDMEEVSKDGFDLTVVTKSIRLGRDQAYYKIFIDGYDTGKRYYKDGEVFLDDIRSGKRNISTKLYDCTGLTMEDSVNLIVCGDKHSKMKECSDTDESKCSQYVSDTDDESKCSKYESESEVSSIEDEKMDDKVARISDVDDQEDESKCSKYESKSDSDDESKCSNYESESDVSSLKDSDDDLQSSKCSQYVSDSDSDSDSDNEVVVKDEKMDDQEDTMYDSNLSSDSSEETSSGSDYGGFFDFMFD